jgi:hypothetical protein
VPACAGTPGTEAVTQIWHTLDLVGCQGPYLGLRFASGMPLYRESPEFMSLTCDPDTLIYVPAAERSRNFTPDPSFAYLRTSLKVRLLLVDDEQVTKCLKPTANERIIAASQKYDHWRIDDRFWVIDLDTPQSSS